VRCNGSGTFRTWIMTGMCVTCEPSNHIVKVPCRTIPRGAEGSCTNLRASGVKCCGAVAGSGPVCGIGPSVNDRRAARRDQFTGSAIAMGSLTERPSAVGSQRPDALGSPGSGWRTSLAEGGPAHEGAVGPETAVGHDEMEMGMPVGQRAVGLETGDLSVRRASGGGRAEQSSDRRRALTEAA